MIVIKTKCILSQMLATKTNWLHNYQALAEWALVQKTGSAQGQCPGALLGLRKNPRAMMSSWFNPKNIGSEIHPA